MPRPFVVKVTVVPCRSVDLTRRRFLGVVSAVAIAARADAHAGGARRASSPGGDPFTLGVASGDPHPDSVVLWTRLAPEPLEPGGGLGSRPYDVDWCVSSSPSMGDVTRAGRVTTNPDHANAVHVVAGDLRPSRDYWYQFRCGSWLSPIGRTRTAPAQGRRVGRVAWATASCQAWEDGHYTAHRHLADDDVDLVIFLGDYIYERPIVRSARAASAELDDAVRREADTLDRYRRRYGLYKRDPDLQAAHQSAPWIVTCDDHEVQDGYVGRRSPSMSDSEFRARRQAAYQAFWEHQPVRAGPPRRGALRLHRRATYGDLVTFHVLDTRQRRSPGAAGDTWLATSPARTDPSRTVLGAEQEAWLDDGLRRSATRWNVVAQQVLAGRLDLDPGDGELYRTDAWDGYAAAQHRLHGALARSRNPIVLSGDVHAAYALDSRRDGVQHAVELATSSISSGRDGAPILPSGRTFLDANEHLRLVDQRRGYLRCEAGPDLVRAEFRAVPYVERTGAPIVSAGSFVVEDGDSQLQPESA